MHKTKIISHILKAIVFKETYYSTFFLLPFIRKFIVLIFIFLPFWAHTQVKFTGTPSILNYTKSEYNAGTQNWGIAQDKNGFMFFANNDGVLRFDGIHWELFPVPTMPVRSITVDEGSNIYVGLYNDFGIMEQNAYGKYVFKSLRYLLPSDIEDFDDVWKIYKIQGNLFFQSYDYLFILNNEKIQVIRPRKSFQFTFNVNERLLIYEPDFGLFEYRNENLDKIPWSENLKGKEITEILEVRQNYLLIVTNRDGVYKVENGKLEKWNVPAARFAEEFNIFSATKIRGNFFAFGSITNGLVISDANGEIVQHLNKNRGLQNNTILSIFADHDENLWLGLDNGIDYVEINSPLSYISDFEGLGAGYCAQIFDGKLYLGTNQGLYVKSFNNFLNKNEQFKLIENTTGQVWSLKIFDGTLFCGHNFGTFIVQGNEAEKISKKEGGWDYIKLNDRDDLVLGGHYNGLQLFRKSGDSWSLFKTIKGFNESSRFLFQDNEGTIWMSHGGKGIFSIRLNQELDSVISYTLYNSKNGLPSDEQNILFGFSGRALISTVNGIFSFNRETSTFVPATNFLETFQVKGRLKTFKSDSEGNFWFIADDEAGVFRLNEDLSFTKITIPFMPLENKFVNEFEFVYPFNNDHVFIGIENGFAHYSSKFLKSYSRSYKSFITQVELPYLDSTLVLLNRHTNDKYKFPFKKNAFRFHFTAPFFEGHSRLQFSYFLENYDDDWSEWSSHTYRDFTNLSEGEYVFKMKTRNIYGEESETATFHFEILPPWHRSILAYFIYFILIVLILYLVMTISSKRMEAAKIKEIEKHREVLKKREQLFRQQALLAEKENIQLRNEKLKTEMTFRDKELANQTMNIIQKNEFLVKLRDELQHLQKSTSEGAFKTKLVTLLRRINKEIDNKQQNQIFDAYFDEVHEDFFEHLRNRFPDLSAREMRLSAYIRMNLTTKEIAVLLNISDRGVEIARYRLRKKLNLERETNLTSFLLNI